RRDTPDVLPPGLVRDRCADVGLTAFAILEIHPAGQRTVRRRLKVRPAAEAWIDEETAIATRVRSGDDRRPAATVEAAVPVLIDERRPGQKRAVGAIEHVQHAVAIRVQQQLAALPVP